MSAAETKLTRWLKEIDELHDKYRWLLFFRVPKMMILHRLIIAEDCCLRKIVSEVGFLFQSDSRTWEKLTEIARVSLPLLNVLNT